MGGQRTAIVHAIGVDPGGTTGLAWLSHRPANGYRLHRHAQLNESRQVATWVAAVMRMIVADHPTALVVLAIEAWARGPRDHVLSRGGTGAAQAQQIIADLSHLYGSAHGVRVVQRRAIDVKPWATDERVALVTGGQALGPHARDAVRHAAYALHRDLARPDPLLGRPG